MPESAPKVKLRSGWCRRLERCYRRPLRPVVFAAAFAGFASVFAGFASVFAVFAAAFAGFASAVAVFAAAGFALRARSLRADRGGRSGSASGPSLAAHVLQ